MLWGILSLSILEASVTKHQQLNVLSEESPRHPSQKLYYFVSFHYENKKENHHPSPQISIAVKENAMSDIPSRAFRDGNVL